MGLKAPEPQSTASQSDTPPDVTVTASNGDSISVPFTPKKVTHVNQLVRQIKAGNCDPAIPESLVKHVVLLRQLAPYYKSPMMISFRQSNGKRTKLSVEEVIGVKHEL